MTFIQFWFNQKWTTKQMHYKKVQYFYLQNDEEGDNKSMQML